MVVQQQQVQEETGRTTDSTCALEMAPCMKVGRVITSAGHHVLAAVCWLLSLFASVMYSA